MDFFNLYGGEMVVQMVCSICTGWRSLLEPVLSSYTVFRILSLSLVHAGCFILVGIECWAVYSNRTVAFSAPAAFSTLAAFLARKVANSSSYRCCIFNIFYWNVMIISVGSSEFMFLMVIIGFSLGSFGPMCVSKCFECGVRNYNQNTSSHISSSLLTLSSILVTQFFKSLILRLQVVHGCTCQRDFDSQVSISIVQLAQ